MALLSCRTCGGDGLIGRAYVDHIKKTVRVVFVSCPKCEPHGDEVALPRKSEELIGIDEIAEEYIRKGYTKIT